MELFEDLFIVKVEGKTQERHIPLKEGGMLYWYNRETFKAYIPYKLRKSLIKHLERIGVYDIFVADFESEFMISTKKIYQLDKFIEIEKVMSVTQELF